LLGTTVSILHAVDDAASDLTKGFYQIMEIAQNDFDVVPLEMRERDQWFVWRYEKRDGKLQKIPYQVDGKRKGSSTDPATWTSFDEAVGATGGEFGLAFNLGNDWTFTGVDLDDCLDQFGALKEWAEPIVDRLKGVAYGEISPSGVGLKFTTLAKKSTAKCSKRVSDGKVEIFDHDRFWTVTGKLFENFTTIGDGQSAVDEICSEYLTTTDIPIVQPVANNQTAKLRAEDKDRCAAAMAAILKVDIPASENDGSNRLLAYARQAKRFCADERQALQVIRSALTLHPVPKNYTDDAILNRIRDAEPALGESFEPRQQIDASGILPQGCKQSDSATTKTSQQPAVEKQEPFPVELLPPIVREYVAEGAESRACDESVVALPVLVTLAACIGTTRRIEPKRGWPEPSILWGAVVGRSGTLKSPGLDLARDIIERGERDALRRHNDAMADYKVKLQRYEKDLAAWKRGGKNSNASDPPAEPERPAAERLRVDDQTIEALAPILQENPKGLIAITDELRAWFAGMGAYQAKSGGRDESKWLELHFGRPAMVDRKTGRERIYIPMAAVSVVGTIQPAVFAEAVGGLQVSSGLLGRILVVMPEPRPKRWTDFEMEPATQSKMVMLAEQLRTLDHIMVDGELRPIAVPLTSEAKNRFKRFVNQHGSEAVQQSEAMAAAYSKLEGAALRFALLFHLCRWSAGETGYSDQGPIGINEIQAGIELARWFAGEAERVYRVIGVSLDVDGPQQKDAGSRHLDRLYEWLVDREDSRATEREIRRSLQRYKRGEHLDEDCRAIVDSGRAYWDNQPKTRYLVANSAKHSGDTADTSTCTENARKNTQVSESEPVSVGGSVGGAGDTCEPLNRHLNEKPNESSTSGSVGGVGDSETQKRMVI
jgi:hypothetical protein